MKRRDGRELWIAAGLLGAFLLWTAAVCVVDVQAIGPRGSNVGFAGLNGFIHDLTGVHMALYTITDWLSLIPVAFALGFAGLGLEQWIRRKNIWKVDFSILALGGFYIVVMAVYLLFEFVVINYRPVLIEGVLEASYPSSTTVLVMCVMLTAKLQLHGRIKTPVIRLGVEVLIYAFVLFMVVARLMSGIHWLTDIIGGVLLSTGLVLLYDVIAKVRSR